MQGIRGATTVERNDAGEILAATDELLRVLIEANGLEPDDIVSALFTVTRDLDAAFPARLRHGASVRPSAATGTRRSETRRQHRRD